jgi:hypothetical protein
MKKLSEDAMLQLLEATSADRDLLARRMAPALDHKTADWLAKRVQDRSFNVTTVCRDGQKLGAIWWWYSASNSCLVLNAGASFTKNIDTTPAFFAAYEILAHQVGAKSIELSTARAGVAKVYRAAGWIVEGVNLRLFLT